MNGYWKLIWFLLAFACEARADGIVETINTYLPGLYALPTTPSMAETYLSQIFGSVGVLQGVPNVLLSNVFYMFNIGIIAAVGMMLAYSMTLSVLNTAGEGNFLGQKMQGTYYHFMIRVVSATAALVPVQSGYSLTQAVLLSTALQGSLFADLLWANVVLMYKNYGFYQTFHPDSNTPSELVEYLQNTSGNSSPMSSDEIGHYNGNMDQLARVIAAGYNASVCFAMKHPDQLTAQPTITVSDGRYKVDYGSYDGYSCGSMEFYLEENPSNEQSIAYLASSLMAMVAGGSYVTVYDVDNAQQDAARITGIQSSIQGLTYGVIPTFHALQFNSTGEFSLDSLTYGGWLLAAANYEKMGAQMEAESVVIGPLSLFFAEPNDHISGIKNYLLQGQDREVSMQDYHLHEPTQYHATPSQEKKDLRDYIMKKATEYFGDSLSAFDNVESESAVKNHSLSDAELAEFFVKPMKEYRPFMDDYRYLVYTTMRDWRSLFLDKPYELVRNPIQKLEQFGVSMINTSGVFFIALTRDIVNLTVTYAWITLATTAFLSIPTIVLSGFAGRLQATAQNMTTACFTGFQLIGALCIIILIVFFPLMINIFIGLIMQIIGTIMAVVTLPLATILPSVMYVMFQIGLANKMAYLSYGFAVAVPLMALGSSIAFYVPFIPILVYTLASIGWFISVIEMMIAIPLVLLGVTNPKGHDLLGSAQQAMILFLSVFLRPVLIVMGYVFSIVLTSVMVLLASQTFILAALHLMQSTAASANTITQLVVVGMTMVLYAVAFMNLIDYCFSFVYRLPATVMKWIGLPAVETPEEQMIQEIRSGIAGATSQFGEGFSGMAGSAAQSGKGLQAKAKGF